ncbi:Phosducin-like protein [Hapsidospora chrysogenum ATCC 11550]|uniref:Phosducin-like protein n=1 Tax=Hapsidospora chrysogenum (strain ATCC 11550 / CBS 779.69 / DSM 880 / IAM 14645 / JCM 23072 / IMI 49137) TaxID=857340 RepID=A0A086T3K6_HAPC1|nr:Phosducin-like protein [Hapsidospora chrysogenum ATCC 11550]
MTTTAAQDEFNDLVAKNSDRTTTHPEDRDDPDLKPQQDLTEEDEFRNGQINSAMRTSTSDRGELRLPPASFDSGRTTGVKGVIADARSYETARKSKWKNRVQAARRSIFGLDSAPPNSLRSGSETDEDGMSGSDDDSFLAQWRESRRRELEAEGTKGIRNRRTSPSVREFGRLDEVDAMGYLDAIEKVGRETTVVVFVHDHECEVSASIESAIRPLVKTHRAVHFVKVHYDDIEFDPAAVPSILAYRNQGDLVANLTGLIEMIPDDDNFGPDALKKLLQRHGAL